MHSHKGMYLSLIHIFPKDTDIDQLVKWMKDAGIEKCVCMGQDMHRIWNSEFGEIAVETSYEKYPDFFIPFCSVEPIDSAGRFNQKNYDYVVDKVTNCGYKGILFTPPYGPVSYTHLGYLRCQHQCEGKLHLLGLPIFLHFLARYLRFRTLQI